MLTYIILHCEKHQRERSPSCWLTHAMGTKKSENLLLAGMGSSLEVSVTEGPSLHASPPLLVAACTASAALHSYCIAECILSTLSGTYLKMSLYKL